jgi:hypothetical protein
MFDPQGTAVTIVTSSKGFLGQKSYILAEYVRPNLVPRPAQAMTLEEAERRYARHGITAEVLAEALRIVGRRERG